MTGHFSDFEVMRVGETVVFSCFADGDRAGGHKIQLTLELGSHDDAVLHEAMFKRLAECATVYQDIPDEALQATIQLMRGKAP